MMKTRLFQIKVYNSFRRYTSFLSSGFNKAINTTPNFSFENVKADSLSNTLNVFIEQENRQLDIVDQLLELRKQKETTAVPLFPSVVVKQILNTTSVHELQTILCNRLKYGLFLDPYVACFLLDHFLFSNNFDAAFRLVYELVHQNNFHNELIQSFSLKATYEYLKKYSNTQHLESKSVVKEIKLDETKVRIKFLRNFSVENDRLNNEDHILGKTLLKLCQSINTNLKNNFELFGFILCNQQNEMEVLLQKNNYQKDVLLLCLTLLNHVQSDQNTVQDVKNMLNRNTVTGSLEEDLDTLIQNNIKKNEPQLIKSYNEKYREWKAIYEDAIKKQLYHKYQGTRIRNIDTILVDLTMKRQNLWFFDEKDTLDIKIFKKTIYYPKKWFGKKKKPKVIDNFYMPPEVTRKCK